MGWRTSIATGEISLARWDGSRPLTDVFLDIGRSAHISIVAEIQEGLSGEYLPPPFSLNQILLKVDPRLTCSSTGRAVHISSAELLVEPGNALNHKFRAFKMPSNIDGLRISLQERLSQEGFRDPDAHELVRELGGFISADAENYPLRTEVIQQTTARDILMRAAEQQPMISVIQFRDPKLSLSREAQWKFAKEHWLFQHQ